MGQASCLSFASKRRHVIAQGVTLGMRELFCSQSALQGRHDLTNEQVALSGLGICTSHSPRALPWAISCGPVGASRCTQSGVMAAMDESS